MQRLARGVGCGIEVQAEPGQPSRDGLANGRRVLADASREHEAVEPLHGGRQHPGEERDPVGEVVERQLRPRVGAGEQLAHVVADAGEALEAALLVEKRPRWPPRSFASRSSGRARRRGRAGPGRVPMGRPSSAVKPIVLSTLRPASSAHMEAPLPRWATITFLLARSGATSRRRSATYSYDSPWNP